jgi:hypothetical protein
MIKNRCAFKNIDIKLDHFSDEEYYFVLITSAHCISIEWANRATVVNCRRFQMLKIMMMANNVKKLLQKKPKIVNLKLSIYLDCLIFELCHLRLP